MKRTLGYPVDTSSLTSLKLNSVFPRPDPSIPADYSIFLVQNENLRVIFFFFFFNFCFLGLRLQHMEVPSLGVKSELQLPATVTAM